MAAVVVCAACIPGRHEECLGRQTPGRDCACIVCGEVSASAPLTGSKPAPDHVGRTEVTFIPGFPREKKPREP